MFVRLAEDVVDVDPADAASAGPQAQNGVHNRCRLPADRLPGVGADAAGPVARRGRRRRALAPQRREQTRRYATRRDNRQTCLLRPSRVFDDETEKRTCFSTFFFHGQFEILRTKLTLGEKKMVVIGEKIRKK